MTIFRYKKDGKLYLLVHEKPMKYTGSWYTAIPFFKHRFDDLSPPRLTAGWGKIKTNIKLKDFVPVAHR